MPFYEYECECGNRFEQLHSIAGRHNAVCKCGRLAHLLISLPRKALIAEFFTVMKHDGTVLSQIQTTERIPMPYHDDNGEARKQ